MESVTVCLGMRSQPGLAVCSGISGQGAEKIESATRVNDPTPVDVTVQRNEGTKVLTHRTIVLEYSVSL